MDVSRLFSKGEGQFLREGSKDFANKFIFKPFEAIIAVHSRVFKRDKSIFSNYFYFDY
jgi:hypothetical protein